MKDILETSLHQEILRVFFVKRDKTPREIVCTLDENRIPERERGKARVVSEDRVIVWDVEKNGWRTINLETVTGVERVL